MGELDVVFGESSSVFLPRVWTTLAVASAGGCVAGGLFGWRRDRRMCARAWDLLGPTSADPSISDQRRRHKPAAALPISGGSGMPAEASPDSDPVRRMRQRVTGWLGGAAGRRDGAVALGTAALVMVTLGGVPGWLVGGLAGCVMWRWMRRRTAAKESTGTAEERVAGSQLPLTADLLAACLAAGSGPRQAAEAVGHSLGGPLGERLAHAAEELRLGAEPAAAWGKLASLPDASGLASSLERAGAGGVPAVQQVTRFAAELRSRRARVACARARRVAVLVTGPLGLCFLPAFLAVGVAPVVLGLAGSLR